MKDNAETMEKYFKYLDALRASGATNMYAATSYPIRDFDLDWNTAADVLGKWMDTFAQRHPKGFQVSLRAQRHPKG